MIEKYAKLIDHTKLSADTNKESIVQLCSEAKKYNFFSICINPYYIDFAKKMLAQSDVKICTVIGFPLGQNTIESKIFETINAIDKGVDEIDMVINIAKLKEKDFEYCINEINCVKRACKGKILKVIVETCLLSQDEKELACEIVNKSDADFIKTSTGFSMAGATFEDIALFKDKMQSHKKIKAAGGIKTGQDLIKMVELGANRIGTSRGVALMKDLENGHNTIAEDDNSY